MGGAGLGRPVAEAVPPGSVAPASYAALPRLAQIASERPDVAIDPSLFLFASIISSIDGPPEIATVRELYATEIADLVPVADHKLDLVSDRADVVYALQTVAALENLSPWQRWLEGPPNEEVELECPSCGDHVYLELVGGELVATIDPTTQLTADRFRLSALAICPPPRQGCSTCASPTATRTWRAGSFGCSVESPAPTARPSSTPLRPAPEAHTRSDNGTGSAPTPPRLSDTGPQ